MNLQFLNDAWKVLSLFLIPVGGGIPGGVLLAQKYGMSWPLMMLLYLISDIILAFVFEPILRGLVFLGRHFTFLARIGELFKKSVERSTTHFGKNRGPLALVMIAFGVDPMTGRAAAISAGYGFVGGWIIAISGDMIYFTVLMISTLWLNEYVGDGTTTMLIILAAMILMPPAIRRARALFRRV